MLDNFRSSSKQNQRLPDLEEPLLETPSDLKPRSTRDWHRIATNALLSIIALLLFLNLETKLTQMSSSVQCSPVHEVQFTFDGSYQNTRHEYDDLWNDLKGHGGIQTMTKTNETYGTGMFHQLHCLASFRHAIQQLQDGHQIGHSWEDDVSDVVGHWPHCFDYLRQVLLCYADDTLEPTNELGHITGYSNRLCRDSSRLMEIDAATSLAEADVED